MITIAFENVGKCQNYWFPDNKFGSFDKNCHNFMWFLYILQKNITDQYNFEDDTCTNSAMLYRITKCMPFENVINVLFFFFESTL